MFIYIAIFSVVEVLTYVATFHAVALTIETFSDRCMGLFEIATSYIGNLYGMLWDVSGNWRIGPYNPCFGVGVY